MGEPAPNPLHPPPPRRLIAALALSLLAWIAVMVLSPKARAGSCWPLAAGTIALLLSLVPQVRRTIAATMDRMRHPHPRTRRQITILIALLATLYLLFTARHQGRDLNAKEQDESMYLIQTQMLARGHLSMPAHPHAEFFESYHVFARPKYAAIYFPGTALMYVLAVWLHLPFWMISLSIAGAAVGMTYRVIAELLDGAAGLLAALLLVGNVMFRHLSTMVMSHTVMLLLALLMTWAFLRWRHKREIRFALLLGLFSGWAAITRPLDALCFAVPIGIMMLGRDRTEDSGLRTERKTGFLAQSSVLSPQSCFAIFLAAAPFLLLQLIFNLQLAGHALKTPVTEYHEHYWPQVRIALGGSADEAYHAPPTVVPQFRDYYEHYILDQFRAFRRANPLKLLVATRLPLLLDVALPFSLLLVFAPLALFGLRDRTRWAFILPLPLLLIGYASFMFFRKHYGVVVFPALYLLILLGIDALRRSLPAARTAITCFCTLLILALVAVKLPEINPSVRDQISLTPILHDFNLMLASIPHKPALVFVKYHPEDRDSWAQEPVYNTDVPWPDDAPVIRAHDLGPRNIALISYYARLTPRRWVYMYDKTTRQLQSLGPAK